MKLQGINLSKSYSGTKALQDLSFEMSEGIYGLLGANGAGKTTLLQLLAMLINSDTGTIRYEDKDIAHHPKMYRKKLGYLPQECRLPEFFTVQELLIYIAQCKEIPFAVARQEIDSLLEIMNLTHKRNHKIKTLSGGMKQRLAIAQTFLGNPEIILLDEPTRGLDVEEQEKALSFIASHRQKTVIISSHIISDIESICSSLLILSHGELLYNGLITDLPEAPKDVIPQTLNLKAAYLQLIKPCPEQ
jgi:ABC-2 type transport system ATP-binding protein